VVPLSILTKSSGNIAGFCLQRIYQEKHAKTVKLKRKLSIYFNCKSINTKPKIAEK
jgi:hypothetical protein